MIKKEYDDGKKHIHVLSYGGGTQSTALLLMALKGEINGVIPDYIIFSDVGWEPKSVYKQVEKVNEYIKQTFNREIIMVKNGNIRDDILKHLETGQRLASLPFFTRDKHGQIGIVGRQCTNEYKIKAVNSKIRELLGYEPRKKIKEMVHIWKGISIDEMQRVKPIPLQWQEAEHPLVDVVEMTKPDCIAYVEREGLGTPVGSSCIGCPFHSNKLWGDMKKNDPESWDDAVFIDEKIRRMPRFKNDVYLHRSGRSLKDIEFKEQIEIDEFINECEGMCGV